MKTIFLHGLMVVAFAALSYGQVSRPMAVGSEQELVNKYCVGCHNQKRKSGGFSWTSIDLAHPDQNAEQSEKVIRKLRAGMMPPAGAPRPDVVAARAFASALETDIDRAAAARPNPGLPPLHRLNRTEYANSIRDLLGIDVDVSTLLPPDHMTHGFDNMADALSISPALMEGYVKAANEISRLAVGDVQAPPLMVSYNVSRLVNQMRHVEGTPLGTRGGISVMHNFPADGEYTFKVLPYFGLMDEPFGETLPEQLKGQQIDISVDGARVALFTIDAKVPESQSNMVTPPIKIMAGPHRISAAFLQKAEGPVEDEFRQVEQSLIDVSFGLVPGMTALPHLHAFTVTGPLNPTGVSDTPSRRKIFTCHPANAGEEVGCARKIISTLVRQAYRRPATDADVEDLLEYYQTGRKQGDFEAGIRMVVQIIIADPEFVFRFERLPSNAQPGTNYRVSDLELASRLSYFIWSSAPDAELTTLAGQGKLKDPVVLEKQVRRLLANRRSEALVTNFAGQWLRLQNLKEADPNGPLFPNFSRNLSQSMRRETELLFDSIMREDRSVLDLLTANYTYVDEVLARHYGIPNILGDEFRRVTLTDPNRFGLLGQASILTLTSLANRTSPVQRGKYVMEVLLGTPPPDPPPNVPPLKEVIRYEKAQTVRERMEEHRQVEPCHSCHQMMDPIGLTLENFDAVGVWRNKDSGLSIDASGQMFDGTKLNGPVSLRQAILNHSDSFIGNFTENLLAYGLGRVPRFYDMPAVRSIEREAAQNDNHFSSFILGIVKSVPFQMRAEEAATDAAAKH